MTPLISLQIYEFSKLFRNYLATEAYFGNVHELMDCLQLVITRHNSSMISVGFDALNVENYQDKTIVIIIGNTHLDLDFLDASRLQ